MNDAAIRVVILADDLIWSTRLVALVRSSGADAVPARTMAGLTEALADGVDRAIVDLTARAYDGVAAIATATAAGAVVLAVGQHDDHVERKRALAAGASRVLAYRKLADDGQATLTAWLRTAADAPAAPAGRRSGAVAR